ncbi:MAG TPA: alginate export family protein [Candidatus Acidoferrales bacterium]|nr:alginate export family protein [Candidatus Acidoferrales bacterium]
MKLKWISCIVCFLGIIFCHFIPLLVAAQNQSTQTTTAQDPAPQESAPRELWSFLKEGKISFSTRWRFESFERDGAPFTGIAEAPTLRIALGYESPEYHGFTAFAQGESVIVTGAANYSIPLRPSQNHPNLPSILDPKSLEMNQAYVKWERHISDKNFSLTAGRQELTLNDGRFISYSNWRQVHGSFDAVRLEAELPRNFSVTYAFINRFYREDGYDALDGEEPMHTDMVNLKWNKADKLNASVYALLLNFRGPAQFATSTQTYGARVTGPYQFTPDWSLLYVAEFAKQKNYGTNPNKEDENYYLGEIGPGWRDFSVKAGYAFLGGRSATDLLTTPLAPPRNGWTDLFFTNPSITGGHGLEAAYVNASGPIRFLDGAIATFIYYDYHSDYPHIHYGSELDSSLAYKIKRISNRWEIGWRFGRYWSDHLYSNSLRTSVYTIFTL